MLGLPVDVSPWLLVASVGSLVVLPLAVSTMTMTPPKPKKEGAVVDIEPVEMPRLYGPLLTFYARMTYTPFLGALLHIFVKSKNHFDHVRAFASSLNKTMPTYLPIDIPSPKTTADLSKLAADFTLDKLADTKVDEKEDKQAFRRWTIQDFTSRYRAKTTTPLQVVTAVLDAIDDSNQRSPPLLAFIKSNREEILKEAQESTERYARGKPLGVLDGVPIGVKDELDVVGYTTSFGTSFIGDIDGVATSDAIPVARLKKAGAIVVGKTNMHEIGIGVTGINPKTGTPRNPYNDQHMTGGSSSGSAAAVAAGLVPLAVGCDGGGSIRIPSALCGIVGVKATYQRIPYHFYGAPSVAHVGPMAATVQDAALAYAIMSGPDENVPLSLNQPPPFVLPPGKPSLAGFRVGVFSEFAEGVDTVVLAAYRDTVEKLEALGATTVEVQIPHLKAINLSHTLTILTELSQYVELHPRLALNPETQINVNFSTRHYDGVDFLGAQKIRTFATQAMAEIFDKVDVFLTPTTGSVAPRLTPEVFSAGLSDLPLNAILMRFIMVANFVGIPAMSIPVAFEDKTNLPISMQLQANLWNEHTLFQVARLLEARAPSSKPSIYYSVLDSK
ncbi:unnamed protein product [Aphanomyces euteiches]|uniref:Amidase domain-containing protein n=1 Tax=Aphanomyces euteiches TaxID=100861 RepID=A0A6G0XT45_9STRA|nr:hypothetical protein Ae201684_001778 [Aphanomyces euteiches]KAH9071928.1 hypothetical protein Ae201684P_020185 [Aphanomyces euteiches]KAH9141592.1 hypothetical protein AeRB84_014248 [Aphanomyces euteiches]